MVNLISLVVKCRCHCTYTNENSDNGNQKATSEYGVSFKQKSPTNIHFIVQFNSCFTSLFKCLRWLNTVFTRAFADAIQHVHKDFKTTNMPSIERSFYLLNTRAICVIFLYN